MEHKQIWTEIAEAFLVEPEKRTDRQKTLSRGGLCWAFQDLGRHILLSDFTRAFYSGGDFYLFWLPIRELSGKVYGAHKRKYDLIRGDFATLMACMAEKEFNQLIV